MSHRGNDTPGAPSSPEPRRAIREVVTDRWKIRLDVSEQVLQIDVPKYNFMSRDEDGLLATLPRRSAGLISAAALLYKAKQFDDGLVAAVELASQRGTGHLIGKRPLLQALLQSLLQGDTEVDQAAQGLLFSASILGGLPNTAPDALRPVVQRTVDDFLADERRSKPLGFYTWSDELRAVFQQDRLLQTELRQEQARGLAELLERTRPARSAYEAHLRLAARLTNPLAGADLRAWLGNKGPVLSEGTSQWSFFPASRSHEAVLLEKLYGDRPIPDGFDLMNELIRRARAGELRLEPTDISGWYDYQTWSLEPLIRPDAVPEASRLRLEPRYRNHLERLFKGMLALARETHVKQVKAAVGGCAFRREVVYIEPDLGVEPLPEVYRRRAAAYRFVRGVLDEAFSDAALRTMHRLTSAGPVEISLADEIAAMESLFEGACRVACRDMGLPLPTNPPGKPDEHEAHFLQWAAGQEQDGDLSRDGRMMVPVFHDVQRRQTKVWAFLGWDRTLLQIAYAREPSVVSCEGVSAARQVPEATDRLNTLRKKFRKVPEPEAPPPAPDVQFRSRWCEAAVPVFAEVYVRRLLDRNEFRKHCDRYRTKEAILANLC